MTVDFSTDPFQDSTLSNNCTTSRILENVTADHYWGSGEVACQLISRQNTKTGMVKVGSDLCFHLHDGAM